MRLEGVDADAVRDQAAAAARALQELSRLVAGTLGREESLDRDRVIGVEVRLPSASPAVYTYCDYTTGECLYVYDDHTMICRPCGPAGRVQRRTPTLLTPLR